MGSTGVLSWEQLESSHGSNRSLVIWPIEVQPWDRWEPHKSNWTNNSASGWWRAIALSSWDRMDSRYGFDWTLVTGSIGA